MKKILFISLFVLGLIIPNIDVKAVDVSNEEQLRAAIEQGGDITLTQSIEIHQTLEIDKNVNIRGSWRIYVLMQGDNTLMTVNGGNVTLNDVTLYAGWNGQYNERGNPNDVIKNQGKALVVNGGNVNFGTTIYSSNTYLYAGNVGLEVNGGTITGTPYIYAGVKNNNSAYSGGRAFVVNGGTFELNFESEVLEFISGGPAITLNNGANLTINGIYDNTSAMPSLSISSREENGIEINDGSVLNIVSVNGRYTRIIIFGVKNAIYLNGGTVNLSGPIGLSSSSAGHGIYINKGINSSTKGDVLNLKNNFIFGYDYGTTPNFSVYVNPNITELRVTDEKEFLELLNNKLSLGFCSNNFLLPGSQTEEERKAVCNNFEYSNYDGPIESNELSCTVVYINGVKQNEVDSSCNPVIDNENTENNNPSPQIVEVPSTSAYGSIIIIVLGIICVIVSVFVMRKMTKKAN